MQTYPAYAGRASSLHKRAAIQMTVANEHRTSASEYDDLEEKEKPPFATLARRLPPGAIRIYVWMTIRVCSELVCGAREIPEPATREEGRGIAAYQPVT